MAEEDRRGGGESGNSPTAVRTDPARAPSVADSLRRHPARSSRRHELAMEAAGAAGARLSTARHATGRSDRRVRTATDGYVSGEPWQAVAPLRYFNDRAGSIYAGSNEIQRNILAKAALGL